MPKTQKKQLPQAKAAKSKEPKEVRKNTKSVRLEPSKKIVAGKQETGRSSSKQSMLITLIERTSGATVEEMAKATGWQKHSVLGAISGVLRKRLGLSIDSAKEERGRVYRIAGQH